MPLAGFHAATRAWFETTLGEPTPPQIAAWPAIRAKKDTLVAAPTGSGKTLAAFTSAIDELVTEGLARGLPDETRVVYVSPLKALSNDIQKNLLEPLAGIAKELERMGLESKEIRVVVRTGDTPPKERARMVKRPPHILVTTPESLYILLTSEGGRRMLRTARTLIVDEIHALVRDKRGSHFALSVERLEALAAQRPVRIGLSATQRPIDAIARFLVGTRRVAADGTPNCTIVDEGHRRALDVAIEIPSSPLEAVMSGEVWEEIYDRIAELVRAERTTLVFVNTRRLSERLSRHLEERLGAGQVMSHHGSLSREQRLAVEQRLKAGELRALVATASLELGIDVGTVDLVCQVGSTRSIAAFLQRVGRSGHHKRAIPKGRLFPLSRDELVEGAALLDAVSRGELDAVRIPEKPLDILAQQIVAHVAAEEEIAEDALFDLVRGAYPFRALERSEFDEIVQMLAQGFSTRRGRRAAHVFRDGVQGLLRPRKGARLLAITSGGAIPDNADYEVVLEPSGALVGTINEDFAIESMQGDVFQLGNSSWKIQRVEPGRVRVEDARGAAPTIPFWLGEAPARTAELSDAVCRLRSEVERLLRSSGDDDGVARATDALALGAGIPRGAAEQIAEYLAAGSRALGAMPTKDTIVLERFFDESGGMQLVLHSPFGGRINRAWGLSLRKKFCQRWNFELQAAATEDAIVISLGPVHSFALEDVFGLVKPGAVRDPLVQALLVAPMWTTRWRWNASRALAVARWRGSKKVPPRFQRMDADDLITVIFPDSVACAENLHGLPEIPDHPLVRQTIEDCLHEAMDLDGFEALVRDIALGKKRLVSRDLTEPSPLAREVLTARPYAFLDDAPLEERRARAVQARRFLDPRSASELGALDAAAIDRVRVEAWPEATTADELHDALVMVGLVSESEGRRSGWSALFEELRAASRAATTVSNGRVLWVAAERASEVALLVPGMLLRPELPRVGPPCEDPESAARELLRGRLEAVGPVVDARLATDLGLDASVVTIALAALEAEGFVLRGSFTPGAEEPEWCERRLLARIHRYTLGRLRAEIEPVSATDFMRFLIAWQRVAPADRMKGADALAAIVRQLEGFEAPAAAWEGELLPSRVADYDPAWLDALCLAGRVTWARPSPPKPGPRGSRTTGPVRATPIALLERATVAAWLSAPDAELAPADAPGNVAARVKDVLEAQGASFFDDIVRHGRLVRAEAEEGLAELVARSLATSDGFSGLRALLVPSSERRPRIRTRRAPAGMESAGRWSLIDVRVAQAEQTDADLLEHVARVLLRRWGVVARRLVERESALPPWRDLSRIYRRLEARGEIRGGRFVASFTGEQFALPEAIGKLREVRRTKHEDPVLISVSAADPLNLAGIVVPGERIPAISSNRVLYRDGEPIGHKIGPKHVITASLDAAAHWEATNVLLRRVVPRALRSVRGRAG